MWKVHGVLSDVLVDGSMDTCGIMQGIGQEQHDGM